MFGSVRAAKVRDADDIAIAHVAAWRETYPGILPQRVLERQSTVARAERWRSLLDRPAARSANFVACDQAGTVVGFASSGPQRNAVPAYDGEFYGIYVLRRAQGCGLGQALMQAMVRSLRDNGMNTANVWVAARNYPARQFYMALGGRFDAVSSDELGGVVIQTVAFGWDDLSSLAQR